MLTQVLVQPVAVNCSFSGGVISRRAAGYPRHRAGGPLSLARLAIGRKRPNRRSPGVQPGSIPHVPRPALCRYRDPNPNPAPDQSPPKGCDKRRENRRTLTLVYPWSAVVHLDDSLVLVASKRERDRRFWRSVLDGIEHQIIEHLVDPVRVPRSFQTYFICHERDLVVDILRRMGIDDFLAEIDEIDGFWPNFQRTRSQPGHIEQVIYQPGQTVDVSGDRLQARDLDIVLSGQLPGNQLDESTNRSEW